MTAPKGRKKSGRGGSNHAVAVDGAPVSGERTSFEFALVPSEKRPRVSVVASTQRSARTPYENKESASAVDLKHAIGNIEWYTFYRLVNHQFYFGDVQYQRTMFAFANDEGDKYRRYASWLRSSTKALYVSGVSPHFERLRGLRGDAGKCLEIANNMSFVNSYSVKDFVDARRPGRWEYDVVYFRDFLTGDNFPAKVARAPPFRLDTRDGRLGPCGASFPNAPYDCVFFNVRLFSYAARLETGRMNLRALVYITSILESIVRPGGSLVLDCFGGYNIPSSLDAAEDVVHILAASFEDARVVKTLMHANLPTSYSIVFDGRLASPVNTNGMWEAWSELEHPAGSCGLSIHAPGGVPSARLFAGPVDPGVRKALRLVNKSVVRIQTGEILRAVGLKNRLDAAMAVSTTAGDAVFDDIYEETRARALTIAVALPRIPINLIYGKADARRIVMGRYANALPVPTVAEYPVKKVPAGESVVPLETRWQNISFLQRNLDGVTDDEAQALKNEIWHSMHIKREVRGSSQAYLKLSEVLSRFPELERAATSFHICEAPGQFIRRLLDANPGLDWRAQSLNPKTTGRGFGDRYGMISSNPGRWLYGPDGTGDITREANAAWYSENVRADLVTADCGMQFTPETYGKEEKTVSATTRAAFRIARACVRPRGSFVVKMFLPLSETDTMEELRNTLAVFTRAYVVKPTLNPTSTELYMVFVGALSESARRRSRPADPADFRARHAVTVGGFLNKLRVETVAFNLVMVYGAQDPGLVAKLRGNAKTRADKWVGAYRGGAA